MNKKIQLHSFARSTPELVYHTATHKHVPLMEKNVIEAVRKNIFGTQVVGEAALNFGTKQFVLISTDKAINPTSIMGATKWLAECLIQELNGKSGCRFSVVRFGNVLDSNDSVVSLLAAQIKKGVN